MWCLVMALWQGVVWCLVMALQGVVWCLVMALQGVAWCLVVMVLLQHGGVLRGVLLRDAGCCDTTLLEV